MRFVKFYPSLALPFGGCINTVIYPHQLKLVSDPSDGWNQTSRIGFLKEDPIDNDFYLR